MKRDELKMRDDRPRPIWRWRIAREEPAGGCAMRNRPLAVFICPVTSVCTIRCTQKTDQDKESHYVEEQLHRMKSRVRSSMDRNARVGA